jgi:hypothetical protein
MAVTPQVSDAAPSKGTEEGVNVAAQGKAHDAIKEYLNNNVGEFRRLEKLRAIVSHDSKPLTYSVTYLMFVGMGQPGG